MGGFISAPTNLASPSAIGSTTPNTGAFTTLSANNGTITTNSPAITLAQTWNAAGTTFTSLRVNVTDTASNASSLLMDLQVGGTSRFSITKAGYATLSSYNGVSTGVFGGIQLNSGSTNSLIGYSTSANVFYFSPNNNPFSYNVGNGRFYVNVLQIGGGISNTNWTPFSPVFLFQDAGDILAQRNSTNAQTFRIYNTFTDASNYERGFMRWATNVLEIGAEAAGTGTQRQLRFPLGTVTASTPLSITQTWNSAGVTFTGLQLNATDTASASASLLMDLQVGGTSRFKVDKNGSAYVRQGSYNNCGLVFGSSLDTGIYYASNFFYFDVGGAVGAMAGSSGFLAPGGYYGLSAGGASSPDLILTRDAADILAQRRTTNAQAFKLYRTFTDASNYERLGFLATNTTRYTITSENAGTGSARSLEVSFYTAASDPTSTDITSGCFSVWKNSGTGTIKLWANDGGTMKSVALA